MTKKAKQIVRISLLILTIYSLYLVPWILVKAWILPLPDSVQEHLEDAVTLGFDAIIVYIDEKGKPPASYAAGWHDKQNNIPAYPEALFKIASVSKLYKAVAVAKLVNSGILDLNKTLAAYLPELKSRIENADKITLRMLIQHRSGIQNYTDIDNYWATPKETNKERLELVLDKPANFEPGEDYEYSNTNFLLISEIMDKSLGYSNNIFIKKEILDRLGLKNTYMSLKGVNIDSVVSGYHVGYPLDIKTDNQGMLSTAEDLAIFIRALNDGSLFDEGESQIYASLYEYSHTGLIPGYQSIAKYHKDIDAVIIQFTGPTYFEGYNWNLSEIVYNRIVEIVRDNRMQLE